MEKGMMGSIADSLKKSLEEEGKYAQFNDSSYRPVKINSENFHSISPASNPGKAAFIDGGNSEILKAPNFSLQLIRVYCCIYEGNKRVGSRKKEFYALMNAAGHEGRIAYNVSFFGAGKETIIFDSFDDTIRKGKHRIQISGIGDAVRRFAELEAAEEAAGELGDRGIIILDGDLKASVTGERKRLEALYEKAAGNKIHVCALSKTSNLFTETGNAFLPVLGRKAPEGAWYYHPIAEIKNESHKADMYAVRLHRNSRYIFKLEIFNERSGESRSEKCNKKNGDAGGIISLLSSNSTDPVFLGYPYGLVEADARARISDKEKDYLKTRFLAGLKGDTKAIAEYLRALDAHSVLDSISF
ncbi:hypothetical protein KY358_03230 [Candidatus Woesearchaeota archaeon]|nr:hypothetical protein [Candidatus Woesearchaeota archaeon]